MIVEDEDEFALVENKRASLLLLLTSTSHKLLPQDETGTREVADNNLEFMKEVNQLD